MHDVYENAGLVLSSCTDEHPRASKSERTLTFADELFCEEFSFQAKLYGSKEVLEIVMHQWRIQFPLDVLRWLRFRRGAAGARGGREATDSATEILGFRWEPSEFI